MKGMSCLTNLFSSDEVICLVNEGKAVDVVYLDIKKAFVTISHCILWRNWLLMVWVGIYFAG